MGSNIEFEVYITNTAISLEPDEVPSWKKENNSFWLAEESPSKVLAGV